MPPRTSSPIVALLLALAGHPGCASVPAGPARMVVHVDTLAPERVAQFEAARVRFRALLQQKGISDRRGLYFRVGDHTYFSLVPFSRWRDLEQLSADRRRAQQAMKGAVEEYDRISDESLVFPHASEIWSEEPDLSFSPTGLPLTAVVRVELEDVKPTADYEAAWKPIAAALAEARFPLERRTWFSGYGTGRYVSFWLAPPSGAPKETLEEVLASKVGEARAKELLAAWRSCVLRSETLPARFMPEMASP